MSAKNKKRFSIRFSWFWLLTISSILIFCLGLIDRYYHSYDGELTSGLLYPLASKFPYIGENIISIGLSLRALYGLLFPVSLLFNFMYFVIESVYAKKIAFIAGIPFYLSITLLASYYFFTGYLISPSSLNSERDFYNIAQQIEIYVPEMEYKKLENKYGKYDCYQLIHIGEIEESESFKEVTLPVEYAKLSSTGKFYYRKFNGQAEVYFPQKEYLNGYQKGRLWLSNDKVTNNVHFNVVFDERCGWYETFGKRLN